MTVREGAAKLQYYVITSGKGTVYLVYASTQSRAIQRFRNVYSGVDIASIVAVEATL